MGIRQEVLLPSMKENGVIIGINVLLVAAAYLMYNWDVVSSAGLILLIEGAVFMLIGGAMELATSASGRAFVTILTKKKNRTTEEEYARAVNRAGVFTLVGVLLFLESLGLALAFA